MRLRARLASGRQICNWSLTIALVLPILPLTSWLLVSVGASTSSFTPPNSITVRMYELSRRADLPDRKSFSSTRKAMTSQFGLMN